MMGDIQPKGVHACARFNRDESCQLSWHVHNKPNKKGQGQRRKLCLHCSALCAEVFGILAVHHLIECPWIKSETWSTIGDAEIIHE